MLKPPIFWFTLRSIRFYFCGEQIIVSKFPLIQACAFNWNKMSSSLAICKADAVKAIRSFQGLTISVIKAFKVKGFFPGNSWNGKFNKFHIPLSRDFYPGISGFFFFFCASNCYFPIGIITN